VIPAFEQVLKAPLSSRHLNCTPACDEVYVKVAEVEVTVPDGPEAIVGAGGTDEAVRRVTIGCPPPALTTATSKGIHTPSQIPL
jgi:hypothetical protein